jgi:adenine-specific DNA-methyltransferase
VIKYIGSKRLLVPHILAAFQEAVEPGAEILDLFSGTSRVGWALKNAGYRVTANDHNHYAACLARCYVAADRTEVEREARERLAVLATLEGHPGWFTRTYCQEARFFHERNGGRIEAMRERIAAWALAPELEAVLLVSLMEAADRVDSTTGLQMAFLKSWAARAHKPLELRLPAVLPGSGTASCREALDAARAFRGRAAYLDPPYNQHSYRGNYHVWETLVRWDAPEVYGVARKRIDCKGYKSPFNSKKRIRQALHDVVQALDADLLVVSFNDEGHLDRESVEGVLSTRGHVRTAELDYKRYVGAQIGIFNPAGVKVGAPGRRYNKERLYVVSHDARRADRVAKRVHAGLRAAS